MAKIKNLKGQICTPAVLLSEYLEMANDLKAIVIIGCGKDGSFVDYTDMAIEHICFFSALLDAKRTALILGADDDER